MTLITCQPLFGPFLRGRTPVNNVLTAESRKALRGLSVTQRNETQVGRQPRGLGSEKYFHLQRPCQEQ